MRKIQVLLADDHQNLLQAVETLLGDSFEVVGKVCDGQALVAAAAELQPAVIVTDISMPLLDGIAAVAKLKEADCKAKIVFLTVHADFDFVRACIGAGALGYVTKKRMGTDLVSAIQEALAGRIFVSPGLKV